MVTWTSNIGRWYL